MLLPQSLKPVQEQSSLRFGQDNFWPENKKFIHAPNHCKCLIYFKGPVVPILPNELYLTATHN